eukprot:scaffold3713_cov372-Prasinococcus_capsulatus_cf.AAC.28
MVISLGPPVFVAGIALHVDINDPAALALYKDLGYQERSTEAPWMQYVSFRPGVRLMLLVKQL